MTASYDKLLEKWAPILEQQNKWDPMVGSNSNIYIGIDPAHNDFPSLLPIAIKVAAHSIGTNLVNVKPLGGNSTEELERIKGEITQENRDRAINSILEDKDFKPMQIEEHPDYRGYPKGQLFYMDYKYGGTSSK